MTTIKEVSTAIIILIAFAIYWLTGFLVYATAMYLKESKKWQQ